MSGSLRDLFVSIAFKDNASKAVQNVNKSMDSAKQLMLGASSAANDVGGAVKNAANGMKKSSSAVSKVGKTVDDAGKSMSGLRSEFSSANYDVNDFGKAIKTAGSATSNTSKLVSSSGKTFARSSKAVQDARNSYLRAEKTIQSTGRSTDEASRKVGLMGRAFESVKKVVSSTGSTIGRFSKGAASGVSGVVGNISRSVNNAKSSMSGLGRSASVGFGSIVSGAASMAGAIGIVQAFNSAINMVKGSMSSAFKRIDTMEQFERVMTTMLGSTTAANDALESTNEIVKGTAYGLDTAAGSVQRFSTSGTDIQKTTSYVAAFGDAVAFYGDGSDETFARVNSAMAEMATSGTASLGQVRTLTEANIPVFQIYAEATGKSAAEVQKALETGKISSSDFLDTLTGAMMDGTKSFKSIEGAAKEAGASWGGSFANMRAAVARGTQSIIGSIDEMLVSNGLPDMRGMIANFGSAFENALNKVAGAIPTVVSAIASMAGGLADFYSSFGVVSPALDNAKEAFSGIGTTITEFMTNVIIPNLPMIQEYFASAFTAISPLVETVGSILANLGTVILNLVEHVVMPLIPVAESIIVGAFTAIQPVLNLVRSIFSTIANVVGFLVENVIAPLIPVAQSIITTAFDLINPVIRIAASLFEQAWIVIQFLVENIVLPLIPLISVTITGMWTIIKPILDGIITVFNGIADAIEWAVGKFKAFADAASNFKMPQIGMPKWMGGGGLIQTDGSHATGLGRVPKDGYMAELHRNESVLTAEQSNALRTAGMLKGDGAGPTLDLSKAPAPQSTTSTTTTNSANNTFHFHISGDNAKDIAQEVKREVENIFKRLNTAIP